MHYRYSPKSIATGVGAVVGVIAYVLVETGLAGDQWWPYVLLAITLLAALTYWLWDALSEDRHEKKMAKFAGINHWKFTRRTFDFEKQFHSYPFGAGMGREDRNVIRGMYNGERCATFTHRFEEGPDKDNRVEFHFQITLVEIDAVLPTVDILPDDLLAKTAKLIGGQDIDFESAEFNRKWRVKSSDRKYAHDIVHPRVMERLNRRDAQGMAIRVEGGAVLAWQVDRKGPEDLARRLNVLTSIAKLIPEFVLRSSREEIEAAKAERRRREENAPAWAKTPGALTTGRYTGIGADELEESSDGHDGPLGGARRNGPEAQRNSSV